MRAALTGVLCLSIFGLTYAEGAEVRELIAKLKGKDSDERRSAAKDLSELGPEAKPAVAALTAALRDKDLFVRRFSAEALGNIGPDAKAAVSALALSLNDEKKEVAESAVDALGKIGPASIDALTAAVKDGNKDPGIRRKAAVGLGKIGSQARKAVPALTDVLNGKVKMAKGKDRRTDDDIRVEVATALGSVAKAEDKAAIEALKSVSEGKQRNRVLAKAAGDSLKQITGKGPDKAKKKKK